MDINYKFLPYQGSKEKQENYETLSKFVWIEKGKIFMLEMW